MMGGSAPVNPASPRIGPAARLVLIGLFNALLFAGALAASPQLHQYFHSGANQPQHECAVTLISSGGYEHTPAPLVIIVAPAARPVDWVAVVPRVSVPSL